MVTKKSEIPSHRLLTRTSLAPLNVRLSVNFEVDIEQQTMVVQWNDEAVGVGLRAFVSHQSLRRGGSVSYCD